MATRSKKRQKVRNETDFFPSVSAKKCIEQIDELLRRVFVKGTRESVILSGPSGCGKSTVLEQAFRPYREDPHTWNTFYHLQLDGWTQSADPRTCIDEVLLQVGIARKKGDGGVTGSLAEKLVEMGNILDDLCEKENKVGFIIVIDQLEGLTTEQRNQLLLYYLLDLAYTKKFALCVIGMTTILDVMERMEKRVRSRFSNRIINVGAEVFADFEEFQNASAFCMARFMVSDRKTVRAILDVPAAENILQRVYDERKGWSTITDLSVIVASLCGKKDTDAAVYVVRAAKMLLADRTVDIIKDLPHLHLALFLCCFQYFRTHETRTLNYCLAEDVYTEAIKTRLKNVQFGQHLLMEAFADLVSYGLLRFADRVKDEPWKYRSVTITVATQQVRTAVNQIETSKTPTDLKLFCSEVLR